MLRNLPFPTKTKQAELATGIKLNGKFLTYINYINMCSVILYKCVGFLVYLRHSKSDIPNIITNFVLLLINKP